MRKRILITFSVIVLFFGFSGCREKNSCFTNLTFSSKTYSNPFFSIDTVIDSKNGCEYITTTPFILKEKHFCDSAKLYLKDDRIYMQLLKPKSNEFVLFNFQLDKGIKDTIRIVYEDPKKLYINNLAEYTYFLKDIVKKEPKSPVYLFQVQNFDSWRHDYNSPIRQFDVVFFVSKEEGFIGSYLIDGTDNEKHYIEPRGNIMKDYIDYSDYKSYLLL